MRRASTLGLVMVTCVCVFGCSRRDRPPTTEITQATMPAPPPTPADPETDLGAYRNSVHQDISNLDGRFQMLQLRLDTYPGKTDAAQRVLDEARLRRDTIVEHVDGLKVDDWKESRTDLDNEWDALQTAVDRAGDLLQDDARQ